MKINVRFFALYRELVGKAETELDIDPKSTVSTFIGGLGEMLPELKDYRSSMLVAVNTEYVPADHQLADGDEIALIPPVSGG